MKPHKEVDLKQLWMVTADADDYFNRMGGAGRYSGFAEWHVPGLVLILVSGVNPCAQDFLGTPDSYEISPRIWRETDGLPERLAEKLFQYNYSPEVFELYLKKVSRTVADVSTAGEILAWAKFLVDNESRFRRFT